MPYTRRAAIAEIFTLAATTVPARELVAQSTKPELIAGVCAHLWFADKSLADRKIAAAKAANFNMIRWDAPWREVEKTKGDLRVPEAWDYIVDTGNAMGIRSLLILNYGNPHYDNGDKPTSDAGREAFARYARFVAQHFEGRVKHFEVWNEWDIYLGNTTPGSIIDYISLLKTTYPEIKAAAPDVVVIAGALSKNLREPKTPFTPSPLEQLLAAPSGGLMDALSLHLYAHPGGYRSTEAHLEDLVESVFDSIKHSDSFGGKDVYVTEIGWTTAIDNPVGVSLDQQAQLLRRARQVLTAEGAKGMFVYELRDGNRQAKDKEGNFGILTHDWQPKPAATIFSER